MGRRFQCLERASLLAAGMVSSAAIDPSGATDLPPSYFMYLHDLLPPTASDFEISDNKYISSLHCELSRDAEGRGYLKDLSSNGTLLNGARIGRNNQVSLFI